MTLRLYNTLTRREDTFEPIDPANVRMYVCGPTVYDFAHIGNARPVIVFDVLYRLLRYLYGPGCVTYARNITDVDDKIIARAAEGRVAIDDLTARTTDQFHADVAALGCLPPDIEPRATDHIPHMIAMIERLVARGCAYHEQGHVLFHVPAMPDYGSLARRSLDEMRAGARVEVAPYKRDPMDFVLWKPARDDEPGWDSPWGRGRPGWHIECSAMSAAHLGEMFDIHGGGIDLVFPHHENEVAQSRCAHGTPVMARYWLHNGFLQVEGQKMSKSLGNFVTIRDLLDTDRFGGRSWPGEVLRFNMLRTHYRQPLDWTAHGLDESRRILSGLYRGLQGVTPAGRPHASVVEALEDDLNTHEAVTAMQALRKAGDAAVLLASLNWLGFAREGVDVALRPGAAVAGPSVEADIGERVAARIAARKRRDFVEADRIRDELAAMGISLMDNPDGSTDWEYSR